MKSAAGKYKGKRRRQASNERHEDGKQKASKRRVRAELTAGAAGQRFLATTSNKQANKGRRRRRRPHQGIMCHQLSKVASGEWLLVLLALAAIV
jgi:hypothetical protein